MYEPVPIYLKSEALETYKKFHKSHNTEAVSMSGDLAAEWSKLEEIPLRLSLIFHCVESVTSGEMTEKVSAETMQNAIELTNWFKNESLRVYRLFDSEDSGEPAHNQTEQRLIKFIRDQGGMVSVRDTMRGMSFKTVDKTERALSELVKKGAAEWVNIETKTKNKPSRGISLRHSDTLTHVDNPAETAGSVFSETENEDSDTIPARAPISEQNEQTAPDDLGDFMEFIDDK